MTTSLPPSTRRSRLPDTCCIILGRNPDQWALLKSDPSLIPNAINETVRISAPIRSFTRHLTKDCAFGTGVVPAGARVMMIYASANRDEKKFPNPDSFDVARANCPRSSGFSATGSILCVGMHPGQARNGVAAVRAGAQPSIGSKWGEPTPGTQ